MVKISLSKALKLKARLTGRLATITTEIKGNNCKIAGQEEWDIKSRCELRKELIERIVELKTALYKANIDIQEKLYRLAEYKGEITFWSGLDTRNESTPHGYQNTPIIYSSFIKKLDCLEAIKLIENQIDSLQDEVDEYNYTTKIEVDQKMLDLAS